MHTLVLAALGLLVVALLGYHFRDYLFGQKQAFVSLPYSVNNDNYSTTPVDYYEHSASGADPHDENQPLENGVDIYQGPHPDIIPGQYDSAVVPMKAWTDPNSSKYRSMLTENGDMIARRAIDGIH